METSFDPNQYGPAFASLLNRDRRRPLTGSLSDASEISALTLESAFAHTVIIDQQAAQACLAGCWLLADDLHASHSISQSLHTAEGSWWHGVMHRREGDFGNAKYWFRQTGDHPAMEILVGQFGDWDPFDFVDACEQAVRNGSDLDDCLARQQAEWEVLFDWCYAKAIGV